MRLAKLRSLVVPALALLMIGALASDAAAQRRRAPYGRRVVVRGGVSRPVYVRPWYFSGWYGYPWYPYQFGYPYPPYGYYAQYDQTSALRLEVTPRNAEVYVDGYRAGVVDDFDGFFQRLHVPPGEHEIALYLEGYRTVRQQLYLAPRADQKIRYTMVPLQAGESQEPRPEPLAEPEEEPAVQPPMGPGGPGPGGPPPRPLPPPPVGGQIGQSALYGSVSIRVQPADARVLIDGQPWSRPEDLDRLVVQLPGGRHHVEIQREGYESYSTDIDVRPGEAAQLNVSLLQR